MCIRDREKVRRRTNTVVVLVGKVTKGSLTALAYARSLNPDKLVAVTVVSNSEEQERIACLLYTTDAADERSSVNLGGSRTIKKKKNVDTSARLALAPVESH